MTIRWSNDTQRFNRLLQLLAIILLFSGCNGGDSDSGKKAIDEKSIRPEQAKSVPVVQKPTSETFKDRLYKLQLDEKRRADVEAYIEFMEKYDHEKVSFVSSFRWRVVSFEDPWFEEVPIGIAEEMIDFTEPYETRVENAKVEGFNTQIYAFMALWAQRDEIDALRFSRIRDRLFECLGKNQKLAFHKDEPFSVQEIVIEILVSKWELVEEQIGGEKIFRSDDLSPRVKSKLIYSIPRFSLTADYLIDLYKQEADTEFKGVILREIGKDYCREEQEFLTSVFEAHTECSHIAGPYILKLSSPQLANAIAHSAFPAQRDFSMKKLMETQSMPIELLPIIKERLRNKLNPLLFEFATVIIQKHGEEAYNAMLDDYINAYIRLTPDQRLHFLQNQTNVRELTPLLKAISKYEVDARRTVAQGALSKNQHQFSNHPFRDNRIDFNSVGLPLMIENMLGPKVSIINQAGEIVETRRYVDRDRLARIYVKALPDEHDAMLAESIRILQADDLAKIKVALALAAHLSQPATTEILLDYIQAHADDDKLLDGIIEDLRSKKHPIKAERALDWIESSNPNLRQHAAKILKWEEPAVQLECLERLKTTAYPEDVFRALKDDRERYTQFIQQSQSSFNYSDKIIAKIKGDNQLEQAVAAHTINVWQIDDMPVESYRLMNRQLSRRWVAPAEMQEAFIRILRECPFDQQKIVFGGFTGIQQLLDNINALNEAQRHQVSESLLYALLDYDAQDEDSIVDRMKIQRIARNLLIKLHPNNPGYYQPTLEQSLLGLNQLWRKFLDDPDYDTIKELKLLQNPEKYTLAAQCIRENIKSIDASIVLGVETDSLSRMMQSFSKFPKLEEEIKRVAASNHETVSLTTPIINPKEAYHEAMRQFNIKETEENLLALEKAHQELKAFENSSAYMNGDLIRTYKGAYVEWIEDPTIEKKTSLIQACRAMIADRDRALKGPHPMHVPRIPVLADQLAKDCSERYKQTDHVIAMIAADSQNGQKILAELKEIDSPLLQQMINERQSKKK